MDTRENYPCTLCDWAFSLRRSLKRHIKSVHASPDQRPKCPDCASSFSRTDILSRHQKYTACGSAIVACEYCSQNFRRENIKEHIQYCQSKEQTEQDAPLAAGYGSITGDDVSVQTGLTPLSHGSLQLVTQPPPISQTSVIASDTMVSEAFDPSFGFAASSQNELNVASQGYQGLQQQACQPVQWLGCMPITPSQPTQVSGPRVQELQPNWPPVAGYNTLGYGQRHAAYSSATSMPTSPQAYLAPAASSPLDFHQPQHLPVPAHLQLRSSRPPVPLPPQYSARSARQPQTLWQYTSTDPDAAQYQPERPSVEDGYDYTDASETH